MSKIYDYSKYIKLNAYDEKVKTNNQRKRADRWALKYKQDLADYDKIILDNDELRRVNEELNIMQTRTLNKVIHLAVELKKTKDKLQKLTNS
tara:strand:+ start:885 stop:1160 length:276 start_codon:yes stop_codon:yes gene_type:complete